ncbi:hypothetical protein DFR87_13120 [Metallosphaera hakonensis JCM 8857 = DSM 7519]|nr:hypothetical protein DFR87_13120 [Metallosphaera hakonensis JCM 8857 = DSM 7519]
MLHNPPYLGGRGQSSTGFEGGSHCEDLLNLMPVISLMALLHGAETYYIDPPFNRSVPVTFALSATFMRRCLFHRHLNFSYKVAINLCLSRQSFPPL